MITSSETARPPDDDSTGFDDLEREFVRRYFPGFDWVRFAHPSPRHAMSRPLAQARVGLVVTAGAHLPGEPPFALNGEVRCLPVDTEAFELTHIGYDTERAATDPDVVVPIGTLRHLVDAGVVGSIAPTVISTMGLVPRGEDVLERSVPIAVQHLRAEEVDLALLVPA